MRGTGWRWRRMWGRWCCPGCRRWRGWRPAAAGRRPRRHGATPMPGGCGGPLPQPLPVRPSLPGRHPQRHTPVLAQPTTGPMPRVERLSAALRPSQRATGPGGRAALQDLRRHPLHLRPTAYRFTVRREPRTIKPYLNNLSQPIPGVESRSPEKGNGACPSRASGGPCAVCTARRPLRRKPPHPAHAQPLRPAGPAGAPGATAPRRCLGGAGVGTAPGRGVWGPPPQLLPRRAPGLPRLPGLLRPSDAGSVPRSSGANGRSPSWRLYPSAPIAQDRAVDNGSDPYDPYRGPVLAPLRSYRTNLKTSAYGVLTDKGHIL